MSCELDISALGMRSVVGSCQHSNELSALLKFWEFLEWLSNCRLFRRPLLHGVSELVGSGLKS
jgi:hypothetical protein